MDPWTHEPMDPWIHKSWIHDSWITKNATRIQSSPLFFGGMSKLGPKIQPITPSRHRLNLQKKTNPKFHFGFLGKVQIWTKNSTHYPFLPPAEFTKKNQKCKVPLWIFRKGPNLHQKIDPLAILTTS